MINKTEIIPRCKDLMKKRVSIVTLYEGESLIVGSKDVFCADKTETLLVIGLKKRSCSEILQIINSDCVSQKKLEYDYWRSVICKALNFRIISLKDGILPIVPANGVLVPATSSELEWYVAPLGLFK